MTVGLLFFLMITALYIRRLSIRNYFKTWFLVNIRSSLLLPIQISMGDLVDYVVLYCNYVPYDLRPHYVVLLCHLSVYEMQNIKIK